MMRRTQEQEKQEARGGREEQETREAPEGGPGPRNRAREERGAGVRDVKRLADTAQIEGGDRWDRPSGHSGTRRAWVVSLAILACVLLAAGGMTFGPRLLLWVGAGLAVVLGAYSLVARVWSDYE
jgi:hypothetical protein